VYEMFIGGLLRGKLNLTAGSVYASLVWMEKSGNRGGLRHRSREASRSTTMTDVPCSSRSVLNLLIFGACFGAARPGSLRAESAGLSIRSYCPRKG